MATSPLLELAQANAQRNVPVGDDYWSKVATNPLFNIGMGLLSQPNIAQGVGSGMQMMIGARERQQALTLEQRKTQAALNSSATNRLKYQKGIDEMQRKRTAHANLTRSLSDETLEQMQTTREAFGALEPDDAIDLHRKVVKAKDAETSLRRNAEDIVRLHGTDPTSDEGKLMVGGIMKANVEKPFAFRDDPKPQRDDFGNFIFKRNPDGSMFVDDVTGLPIKLYYSAKAPTQGEAQTWAQAHVAIENLKRARGMLERGEFEVGFFEPMIDLVKKIGSGVFGMNTLTDKNEQIAATLLDNTRKTFIAALRGAQVGPLEEATFDAMMPRIGDWNDETFLAKLEEMEQMVRITMQMSQYYRSVGASLQWNDKGVAARLTKDQILNWDGKTVYHRMDMLAPTPPGAAAAPRTTESLLDQYAPTQ